MRLKALVVAAVVLVLAASVAVAAEKGEFSINVTGGGAIPISDFSKAAKTGFTGGVGVDYFVMPELAVGIDGAYNQLALKDTTGENFKLIGGGVHVKYMFPMKESKLKPFVGAGAGYYNAKASLSGSESVNKAEANVGLGLLYEMTPQVDLGLQGQFHNIFTKKQELGEKANAQYFTVGLVVNFGLKAAQ